MPQIQEREVRSLLDPRTKMLLVLTIATVMVCASNGPWMLGVKTLLSAVPLVLYLCDRKWRQAALYGCAYTAAILGEQFLLTRTYGVLNFILVAVFVSVARFMPGLVMGSYLMTTTRVDAFLAAMDRMHVPQSVSISLSVTFRFFPTLREEFQAINRAMRLRGVRFGGGKPFQMVEYRLVPMMISSMKISEELSAAALTRGLGSPKKRTNLCRIGFGPADLVCLALCAVSWILLGLDVFWR